MNEQVLLGLADDELVLGWRDSEWTGIAPMLEEDVAFSSIAQNEIGHARAVYELLVGPDGDADALAFDRKLGGVPLRAARRAPPARVGAHDRAPLALRGRRRDPDHGAEGRRRRGGRRARGEDRPRGGVPPHARRDVARPAARRAALPGRRSRSCGRTRSASCPRSCAASSSRGSASPRSTPIERGTHTDELAPLWEEMTEVRRSAPAGAQW